MIFLEAFLSLLLLAAGYAAVCCELRRKKLRETSPAFFSLTRNRLLYLAAGLVSVGTLMALFRLIYHHEALDEIRLLTLALSILPMSAVDYREKRIPNRFLLAALLLRLLLYGAELVRSFPGALAAGKDYLIGAGVIGLFFLLLHLVFRDGIGMGDVKLFTLMGLYQGLQGVLNAVFFSLIVSFFVSVALLITKKKNRKDTIAFAPCIFLGTVASIALTGI